MRKAICACAALFLVGAVRAQPNRKCGANFKMEVAIMLDASLSSDEFVQQKQFAKKVVNWLPDVGGEVRVTIVPYVYELNKPTNAISDNISKGKAINLIK